MIWIHLLCHLNQCKWHWLLHNSLVAEEESRYQKETIALVIFSCWHFAIPPFTAKVNSHYITWKLASCCMCNHFWIDISFKDPKLCFVQREPQQKVDQLCIGISKKWKLYIWMYYSDILSQNTKRLNITIRRHWTMGY